MLGELLPSGGSLELGNPLALLLAAIHLLGEFVLLLPGHVVVVGVGVAVRVRLDGSGGPGLCSGSSGLARLVLRALALPVPVRGLGVLVLADGAGPWWRRVAVVLVLVVVPLVVEWALRVVGPVALLTAGVAGIVAAIPPPLLLLLAVRHVGAGLVVEPLGLLATFDFFGDLFVKEFAVLGGVFSREDLMLDLVAGVGLFVSEDALLLEVFDELDDLVVPRREL